MRLSAAEIAQRKKLASGFSSAIGALMQQNCYTNDEGKRICKTVSDLSKADVKSAFAAARQSQEAPAEKDLSITGGDEEVSLGPGKKGTILKKYIPILKKHQPDFDFDKFYNDIDSLPINVKEKVLPKNGRDYFFGPEHWNAFILVRDLKDKEHANAVSESYKYLRRLIHEVKQKW